MKFNRATIIAACDYIITTHEAKEARRSEAYELFKAEHRQKWIDSQLPKWKEYRDSITKLLRSGKVITPDSLQHHPLTYQEPYDGKRSFTYGNETFHHGAFRDYEFAVKMKRILSAAMDDGITVTELKSLQISPREVSILLELHGKYLEDEEARLKRIENLKAKEAEAAKTDTEKLAAALEEIQKGDAVDES